MKYSDFEAQLLGNLSRVFSPLAYTGTVYDTECTCKESKRGTVFHKGRWVPVCTECGSLRQ